MNCENPLRREYWLGRVDPRPLALFRIALGVVVLHDLVDLAFDLRAFLTDDGMLPRSVPRDWWAWSLFDLVGSPASVAGLYAVGVMAIGAFTLGYRTRVATVVSWVWLVSLHNRNYFVTDGGDSLVAILFFWSIFADLGACWSLDARRCGARPSVPAFGLRLLQLHIIVLYYATARLKFRRGWLHGAAVYQTLQLEGFLRPFGAWLEGHPALCTLATYSILAMETSFPFFALSPVFIRPARALAVAVGLAIQIGIATAMRVGIFQEAMLASCALFVLPEWLDAAQAWLRQNAIVAPHAVHSAHSELKAQPAAVDTTSHARLFLNAVLALQFVAAIWGFVAARRFPLPRLVRSEMALLAIEQPADLFGTIYEIPHWDAPGVLSDGTTAEVLSVAASGARPRGAGVRFSRWNKFTFKEREHPLPWPTLGPYLCRAFDERAAGPHLVSFDVIDHQTQALLPHQDPPPPKLRHLWHETCGEAASNAR